MTVPTAALDFRAGAGAVRPLPGEERFRQRVALERESFETEAGEALFVAYGEWLEERGLSASLVRRMGAHAEVLRAIEGILDGCWTRRPGRRCWIGSARKAYAGGDGSCRS